MMLRVRSACKINLTLDVIGRRANGYHDLQSVVSTVGLYDELAFNFAAPFQAAPDSEHGRIELHCNVPALQTPDNLVLRAAHAWLGAASLSTFNGCTIHLSKRVPSGAGLGGGSGNAAATLWAFNHAHGNPLSPTELESVGATLGADVPLFLRSAGPPAAGTLLMEGIGERLTPLATLSGWIAIVQPEITLATPAIYRQFDALSPVSRHDTPAFLRALEVAPGQRLPALAAALGNDLTGSAQALGAPVGELCRLLREQGALGASMTGSGSALFGLFEDERSARTAAKLLHLSSVVNFAAAAPLGVAGVTRA